MCSEMKRCVLLSSFPGVGNPIIFASIPWSAAEADPAQIATAAQGCGHNRAWSKGAEK